MRVRYSSDEDDFTFAANKRSRDHSTWGDSASPLRKARHATKAMSETVSQASDRASASSKGFFDEHTPQIVVAALLAGGAAALYFLKRSSSRKDPDRKPTSLAARKKAAATAQKPIDTKKLAMRRKRSK